MSSVEKKGDGRTILLVDDNDEARRAMHRTLDLHGYQVLAVASPEEATRMAAEHEGAIHVLVTDVVMPGMTGPSLARALREGRPDLRVLFVSGYTDREIPTEDHAGAPTAFLEKPMTIQELAEAVDRLLAS